MKTLLTTLAIFVSIIGMGVLSAQTFSTMSASSLLASLFFTQSVTVDGLQQAYERAPASEKKIKVVLVPGHEPDFGGAEYRALKERDMNVELGRELSDILRKDPHYEVLATRNAEMWNPDLENYFGFHWDEIKDFVASQKAEMARLVSAGRLVRIEDQVPHNDAPNEVAVRLYGINKWANEQKADIIIHIHFNDSAPRAYHRPGEYSGFTIYVPEKQYSNAHASKVIAENIFRRLERFAPVSDLPIEDSGIVEEQELIAVGSANTVDGASILIEYGYIYEPQFANPITRQMSLRELAFQTYIGLADFFGDESVEKSRRDTTILPYVWESTVTKSTRPNPDVLAAQIAFAREGVYPPSGATKNDCPPSGVYGACTRTAVAAFQKTFGIGGDGSVIGEKTRAKLNERYGK